MYAIEKANETMTAKERVKRTFEYEKTDRVTIGYESNEEIHRQLCQALGVRPENRLDLYRALGVDYCGIDAPYIGKPLFKEIKDRQVDPLEGVVCKWIANEYGGYWDYCDFPLIDAEQDAFFKYPVPNPDDYDYDAAYEMVTALGDEFALHIGGCGVPDVINGCGKLTGMEDILCLLFMEDEGALDLIERRTKWQIGYFDRLLSKCRGKIDFMWIGEDLGTQHAPMISRDLYAKVLKPVHKQFADLAKAYNIPVIIHSCGSSSWAFDDFIDIGISGVDTLQPEAANMSPKYLADRFGGKLNFRGCISTAGALAYGTAEEVTKNCQETLETMMKVRGYHFAPTHMIQDNSPVENVIAMYNAAHKYGKY